MDSLGLLIRGLVHPANVPDRYALRAVLYRMPLYARWTRVLVDRGYDSPANTHLCRAVFDVDLEVVARLPHARGFAVQPCRWVVERTLAWLGKYRRLSKDYEALPAVSQAWIYRASIHILVRRLAHS